MYIIILKTPCLAPVLGQIPCQGNLKLVLCHRLVLMLIQVIHLTLLFIHKIIRILNLDSKGINIGHLNIQGICGENMSKFSELKLLLTARENCNLHILGLSETKLKDHKSTEVFKVDGFQTPFRKDNNSNGGGGLIVYVRNGLNAKRREDLETNNIPSLCLEITPINCKPFLVGNIYRPPGSKVEFNDRFEEFIDKVIGENKEYILMGDFNKFIKCRY